MQIELVVSSRRCRSMFCVLTAAVIMTTAACNHTATQTDQVPKLVSVKAVVHVEDFTEPIRPLLAPSQLNADKVQLGKSLFHDKSLSADNSLSCASCHDIGNGGDDGRVRSFGIKNQVGTINSPTVINSVFNSNYFWDGRSSSLADQVAGPIHNPLEMGSNWNEVIAKLKGNPERVKGFKHVYGTTINASNIADAIAEYERALVSTGSLFDLFLEGQSDAITDGAKRGYAIFKEVGCISCHQGQNIGSNAFQQFGVMGDYFAERGSITTEDYGRFNVTGREIDRHYFKVPTLRNVEITSPYFHDGNATNLDDAVRIMARYQLGFELSNDEVNVIVEFLVSLTAPVREELL